MIPRIMIQACAALWLSSFFAMYAASSAAPVQEAPIDPGLLAQRLLDRAAHLDQGTLRGRMVTMRLPADDMDQLAALFTLDDSPESIREDLWQWCATRPEDRLHDASEFVLSWNGQEGRSRLRRHRVSGLSTRVGAFIDAAAAAGATASVQSGEVVEIRDGGAVIVHDFASHVTTVHLGRAYQSPLDEFTIDRATGFLPMLLTAENSGTEIAVTGTPERIGLTQIIDQSDVIAACTIEPGLGWAVTECGMKVMSTGVDLSRHLTVHGTLTAGGISLPAAILNAQWIPGSTDYDVRVLLADAWMDAPAEPALRLPAIRLEVVVTSPMAAPDVRMIVPAHLEGLSPGDLLLQAASGIAGMLGSDDPDHDLDADGVVTLSDLVRLYEIMEPRTHMTRLALPGE